MNKWMDGQRYMNGRFLDTWGNGWIDSCKHEWVNVQRDRWNNGSRDGGLEYEWI